MFLLFSGNLLDPERGYLPSNEFVGQCIIQTRFQINLMERTLLSPNNALQRAAFGDAIARGRRQLDGLLRLHAKTVDYLH